MPKNAIRKNIEGYVDIKFNINEDGITQNIQIENAYPRGYFENEAINAIKNGVMNLL